MNRADTETKAAAIIDEMAKLYNLTRGEILQALQKPDIQEAISGLVVFDRMVEEGKTVPMARKIMGKSMYL
jgi:hypothetical protein